MKFACNEKKYGEDSSLNNKWQFGHIMECSIRVVQVTVDYIYMCKSKIVPGEMSVMSF